MSEPHIIDIACRRLVELITDYLEGSLDQPTAAAIEAHLSVCPPCVLYLDQMSQTIGTLGRVPVDTLSDQTKRYLVAAFRELPLPPR